MFNKLSLLALAIPLVNALSLNIPTNPVSGGLVTISWTFTATDGPFSLELVNEQFHNSFAIANNVQPGQGSIDITLPVVPVGGGYTLEAVNIGDINQVFSSTGGFDIGANPSATVSQVSTSATAASNSASASSIASVTVKTSASATAPVVSSSAFGSTVPHSGSVAATNSASGSAQSNAAASPSVTTLPSSSSSFKFGGNKGAMAGVLISALAGAAIVVL